MTDKLREIISIPEWEIPEWKTSEELIRNLSAWDYGEYSMDPTEDTSTVESYSALCRSWRKGYIHDIVSNDEYVVSIDAHGDCLHTLYKKLKGCDAA